MKGIVGIELEKEQIRIKEKIGTILFPEFPSTALYIDSDNELFVKEWVDCTNDGKTDRHFFYKTTKSNLALFFLNQLSHLDLINQCEGGFVYFQDKTGEVMSNYTIVKVSNIPPSYLPDINFKLDVSDIVDFKLIENYLGHLV